MPAAIAERAIQHQRQFAAFMGVRRHRPARLDPEKIDVATFDIAQFVFLETRHLGPPGHIVSIKTDEIIQRFREDP